MLRTKVSAAGDDPGTVGCSWGSPSITTTSSVSCSSGTVVRTALMMACHRLGGSALRHFGNRRPVSESEWSSTPRGSLVFPPWSNSRARGRRGLLEIPSANQLVGTQRRGRAMASAIFHRSIRNDRRHLARRCGPLSPLSGGRPTGRACRRCHSSPSSSPLRPDLRSDRDSISKRQRLRVHEVMLG
jgi:hypothetical protein